MKEIPESDWRYLSIIKDKMLATLCNRINASASLICTDRKLSEYEKFLSLLEHTNEGNQRVARCFDDWRRLTVIMKLLALQEERLLTDEYISGLSAETRQRLKELSEV
jgi:hypothetical protein